MKKYSFYCPKCKGFVGVITPDGIIIGNIILKKGKLFCGCGENIYIRRDKKIKNAEKWNLLY